MTNRNKINRDESKPLISVIMNCYNSDRFLTEAIESVLAQTFQNWELIFWDNKSTDLSAHIVKSYPDPRIKYFLAEEHTKLGRARNLAVERAQGAWIAFLDCDDVWLPWKLAEQVALLDGRVGMVYTPTANHDGGHIDIERYKSLSSSLPQKSFPEGDILHQLAMYNFIHLSSLMVRTDIYQDLGGVDDGFSYAEDYDLVMRVAAKYPVACTKSVSSVYRLHNGNMTNSIGVTEKLESLKILMRYLWSYGAWFGIARRTLNIVLGR